MMTQAPPARRNSFAGLAGTPARPGTVAVGGGRPRRVVHEDVNDVYPDSVAALRRTGLDPYQVLMFGDGVLAGAGLRDHNLGLPGQVADALAESTGRGVDLDVFVDRDPTSPSALAGLRSLRLQRYDAIIVVLGASRSRLHQLEAEVAALAGLLETEGAESAALLIADSSRAKRATGVARWLPWGSGSDHFGPVIESICGQTSRVRFVDLEPPAWESTAGGRFRVESYRVWADVLTQRIRPVLKAATGRVFLESATAFRARPDDEQDRRLALERLGIDRVGHDEFLDTVVRQLKRMYDVDCAAVYFLDGDAIWSRATTDPQPYVGPQEGSSCDLAIKSDGLLVVSDLRVDPRVRDHPAVQSPDGPRFYAGYPIRTWDGYRVGTVCITDRDPRSMDRFELLGLRDFAGRVEQYLWQAALRR